MVMPCFENLSGTKAIHAVQQQLEQAGIEPQEIGFEAYQLVKMALKGKDPRFAETITTKQAEILSHLCQQRCNRVPLQYLAGRWNFLDFELEVGEGVLIPREDTEILCLSAADCARRMGADVDSTIVDFFGGWPQAEVEQPASEPPITILDLCSGSGCVARGILRMIPQASITAVEKSPQAFVYLQKNVKDTNIVPVEQDVFGFEKTICPKSVWVIASNPPYITEQEMKQLAPELQYEPQMALYAPNEGLAFYQYFAEAYRPLLKQGGWMAFEIGATQGEAVSEILQQAGADFVQVLQDGAGRARVVRARFQ